MAAMDAPDFTGVLRRYRCRHHFSQEGLAERTGLSTGAISLVERPTMRLHTLTSPAGVGKVRSWRRSWPRACGLT